MFRRECVRPTGYYQMNVGERFTYIHVSPSLSTGWLLYNIVGGVEFSYPAFQHSMLGTLLCQWGKVVAMIGGERTLSERRWGLRSARSLCP